MKIIFTNPIHGEEISSYNDYVLGFKIVMRLLLLHLKLYHQIPPCKEQEMELLAYQLSQGRLLKHRQPLQETSHIHSVDDTFAVLFMDFLVIMRTIIKAFTCICSQN
ncbi:hypothetical protein AOX56_18050 [Aeromonas sobria]|uniref:Uncharacterized protein n=1 Tax=Aeromonas sobria TaxID=646 RepID=A0A2N3IWN7_AERSO|nr:hypothetical protein AOX56_18050 [Aeromonas sobria]